MKTKRETGIMEGAGRAAVRLSCQEYLRLALRTESVPQNLFVGQMGGWQALAWAVFGRAGHFSRQCVRLNHAALGLGTELAELMEAAVASQAATAVDLDEVGSHRMTALIDELARFPGVSGSYGTGSHRMTALIEELGDLLWYCAIGLDVLDPVCRSGGITQEKALQWDLEPQFLLGDLAPVRAIVARDLPSLCGRPADLLKRCLYYGRPLREPDLYQAFAGVVRAIRDLAAAWGSSLPEVAAANIRKLYVRYPEKFTEEDAVERRLNLELQALEGK